MTKHIRELRREFPDTQIEHTSKRHLRLVLPNGESVITPDTPSDWRGMRNLRGS
jgi:hypothetical protein